MRTRAGITVSAWLLYRTPPIVLPGAPAGGGGGSDTSDSDASVVSGIAPLPVVGNGAGGGGGAFAGVGHRRGAVLGRGSRGRRIWHGAAVHG